LPYLVATRIPAGEALAQSSNEGRFWLHCGQISKGENIASPAVGESWGYPNPVPADWIAQTELLVYKLPAEHWEEVALIAPKHFAPLVDVVSSNGRAQGKGQSSTDSDKSVSSQGKSGRLANPKSKIQNLKSQIPPSPPTTEQEPIAFPQPSKGRSRSRWFGRRYPFIEQQSSSDCGAACLATIGQKYIGLAMPILYIFWVIFWKLRELKLAVFSA
jgi:ATP-binding cassette subfamily B protein